MGVESASILRTRTNAGVLLAHALHVRRVRARTSWGFACGLNHHATLPTPTRQVSLLYSRSPGAGVEGGVAVVEDVLHVVPEGGNEVKELVFEMVEDAVGEFGGVDGSRVDA